MGEEAGDQKAEEKKKPEESEKAEEPKKAEEPEKKAEDEKKADESKEVAPPAPPSDEIVLRVFMHCEGCARKVRRYLKGFEGVEDVKTDCKTHTVVVKGEKADPLKVLERIQKKSHRQVDLLSPIPKPPPADEPGKVETKEVAKTEEKIEAPLVITVVLKVHMHCEACAQEIKKRILRMKGVESAEPDLKSSQVTVKGTFEAPQLVEYVYKRTGKHAVIVSQDPPPPPPPAENKPDEGDKDKDKEAKDDKKDDEGGDKKEEKKEEAKEKEAEEGGKAEPEENNVIELRKNEFYYYYPQNYQIYPPAPQMFAAAAPSYANPPAPQMFAAPSYAYPPAPHMFAAEPSYGYPPAPQMISSAPQMFSDENPNACSVM